MSPTVFRHGPFRFFFLSREEDRLHIHVQSAEDEAKFWVGPKPRSTDEFRRLGRSTRTYAIEPQTGDPP
jgi:hypothetical protein